MTKLISVTIDALRRDVFYSALSGGGIPNIAKALGRESRHPVLDIPATSVLPSVTFCCTASLTTGESPARHAIPGNQFLDRAPLSGTSRMYTFDPHQLSGADDTLRVYGSREGLVNKLLSSDTETIFEYAAARGLSSAVVYSMISRGADLWVRAPILDLARMVKEIPLFQLAPDAFDRRMMHAALNLITTQGLPDLLTLYFLGVDVRSHKAGPATQLDYLCGVIDPLIGKLLDELSKHGEREVTFVFVSDHGQVETGSSKEHVVPLASILDRATRMLRGSSARSTKLLPALNGGSAQVYVEPRERGVRVPFDQVLEAALAIRRAFGEGEKGRSLDEMFSFMLLKNVERDGWDAPYDTALDSSGISSYQEFAARNVELLSQDVESRLRGLSSARSGDIILFTHQDRGYHFGPGHAFGTHGGITQDESESVMAVGLAALATSAANDITDRIGIAIAERCRDGRRAPSILDLSAVTKEVLRERMHRPSSISLEHR